MGQDLQTYSKRAPFAPKTLEIERHVSFVFVFYNTKGNRLTASYGLVLWLVSDFAILSMYSFYCCLEHWNTKHVMRQNTANHFLENETISFKSSLMSEALSPNLGTEEGLVWSLGHCHHKTKSGVPSRTNFWIVVLPRSQPAVFAVKPKPELWVARISFVSWQTINTFQGLQDFCADNLRNSIQKWTRDLVVLGHTLYEQAI